MNAKQYAERIGVPHGTIKRWRTEGLPGRIDHRHHVEIDPIAADAWVAEHHAKSVGFHRSSNIYFAQREDGAVKIGWTADVLRRIAELRKESGANVTLIALFPGDKPDELRLHARFADDRLDGEWFVRSEAIEAFLKTLSWVAA